MDALEVTPTSRMVIKLDFIAPFEAHNTADFTSTEEGSATRLVWAMYGPQSFMNKVMTLFMKMDKLVGQDFEKGLAAMKRLFES